jgi:hypothetical protein
MSALARTAEAGEAVRIGAWTLLQPPGAAPLPTALWRIEHMCGIVGKYILPIIIELIAYLDRWALEWN